MLKSVALVYCSNALQQLKSLKIASTLAQVMIKNEVSTKTVENSLKFTKLLKASYL